MTENLVTDDVAKDSAGADVPGTGQVPSVADELNDSAVASVRALEEPAPPDPDIDGRHPDPVGSGTPADDEADDPVSGRPSGSRRAPTHEQLVAEGDAAGDYLERLLDILDFDGDIDLDVEGERAAVSIIGDSADIEKLVGERGEVLEALQELTRLAATAETGQRSRLMLDIGGYRAQRRTELSALGTRTARDVLDSGEPVRLAPMNPFERKVVHDAVAEVDGVSSSSEGEEPRRRVVVSPES